MYNVIVVDDEEWVLRLVKRIFNWEQYGFIVKLATQNQQEALDYIAENDIDVIMLDINMPGINGLQMMEKIRELNKAIKIVVLSGYSSFDYAQKAIEQNVFLYCLKPITPDSASQIVLRLKEALDEEGRNNEDFSRVKVDIENYKFEKLIKYIKQHYYERLYLTDLSEMFHINLTYCCDLFKKHFDMSFNEYVTSLKMKSAAEMLKDTDTNIDSIAETLNYEYVYFCKLFKKYYKKTPRQYRADNMNEGQK